MRALARQMCCCGVAPCVLSCRVHRALCTPMRCCGGSARRGVSEAADAPPTVVLPDLLDLDESMTLNVYRPYNESDAPYRDATRRFIRTLITTPDEQEWKDMLCAAIRLNTWRDHHVRAVLRSVHQAEYDDCGVQEGLGRSKGPVSTASRRLQRAIGVLQTGQDVGYSAEPASVHALLVLLLRATSPACAASATGGEDNVSKLALTTRAVVWRFLAWMERHDYHVMSSSALQELERIVDDEVRGNAVEDGASSIRQNRLDYLQRERDQLSSNDTSPRRQRQDRGGVRSAKVADDRSE